MKYNIGDTFFNMINPDLTFTIIDYDSKNLKYFIRYKDGISFYRTELFIDFYFTYENCKVIKAPIDGTNVKDTTLPVILKNNVNDIKNKCTCLTFDVVNFGCKCGGI